jgi:hypothetical protein
MEAVRRSFAATSVWVRADAVHIQPTSAIDTSRRYTSPPSGSFSTTATARSSTIMNAVSTTTARGG